MKKEQHTPIIIGNCKPFRIVERDTDNWSPTLEQINNREYDYVKLNRMSTFLDIGIAPFSMGIGFDGSLVLPATEVYREKENAIKAFNRTLGILLLGGLYSESVQPENISYGLLYNKGYIKIHGGSKGHIAAFHKSIRTKLVGTFDAINLLNPVSINISEFQEAYLKGIKIIDKTNNLSPKMLLEGTSHFVKNQWAESLIFLWTSIEQLINQIWDKEIIKTEIEEIIEGRTKFLKDFRSWTTSTKIETLFQKDLIPIHLYKLLNLSRKTRNDFIHNGKPLTKDKVINTLEGLFQLISLIISDYESTDKLNSVSDMIKENQIGELYPKKRKFKTEEVSHWLAIPQLPGDEHWGDKDYEIIEDLELKPLANE